MSPDMEAIEQFRQKDAEYNSRAAELEEATRTRDAVRKGRAGVELVNRLGRGHGLCAGCTRDAVRSENAGAMWGISLDRVAELQEATCSKRLTLGAAHVRGAAQEAVGPVRCAQSHVLSPALLQPPCTPPIHALGSPCVRGAAQEAAGRVHGCLQHHQPQTQGDVPDDHAGG